MRILAIAALVSVTSLAGSAALANHSFKACATGDQEVPAPGVDTIARGSLDIRFDAGLTRAAVSVRLRNIDQVIGAHFHCNIPGRNGPVAFGLFNPGDCVLVNNRINCVLTNEDATLADCESTIGRPVNNIASLYAAIVRGEIYFNVHTQEFMSGEIRGQVVPASVSTCLVGGVFGDDELSDEEEILLEEEELPEDEGLNRRSILFPH